MASNKITGIYCSSFLIYIYIFLYKFFALKQISSCPGYIFTPTCIYPCILFISCGHQLCALFPLIYPKYTNSSLHLSPEMQISSHSVNYVCSSHQKNLYLFMAGKTSYMLSLSREFSDWCHINSSEHNTRRITTCISPQLRTKVKIFISLKSRYLSANDHAKLTSSSLTILIIDCWVCAAHFSSTKPSFFSSSSSLALRRFLHLFWSSCSSASFSLTVPSSL